MDPLFEEFDRFLRSMFQSRGRPFEGRNDDDRDYIFDDFSSRDFRDNRHNDRDFREAWEELDDYLRTGGAEPFGRDPLGDDSFDTGRNRYSRRGERVRPKTRPSSMPPEELRKDYRKIGVPFGSSFEVVRKAYRDLMRTHHPDLFAEDEHQSNRATSMSQDINESFQRIKAWVEKTSHT